MAYGPNDRQSKASEGEGGREGGRRGLGEERQGSRSVGKRDGIADEHTEGTGSDQGFHQGRPGHDQ